MASYRVHRSTTNGFTHSGESQGQGTCIAVVAGTQTSYSDTNAAASTTYYYKVEAVPDTGTPSVSNQLALTTPAAEYRLHRSGSASFTPTGTTAGSGTCIAVLTSTQTSYSDTAIAAGSTSYYKVQAVGASGTTTSNEIQLVSQASQYRLHRSGATGFTPEGTAAGVGTCIAVLSSQTLSHSDTNVTPGSTNYYVLEAVAPEGTTLSNEVELVAGASQYRLHRSTVNGFSVSGTTEGVGTCIKVLGSGVTSFSDVTVQPATDYYYRLVADQAGITSISNQLALTTPAVGGGGGGGGGGGVPGAAAQGYIEVRPDGTFVIVGADPNVLVSLDAVAFKSAA